MLRYIFKRHIVLIGRPEKQRIIFLIGVFGDRPFWGPLDFDVFSKPTILRTLEPGNTAEPAILRTLEP